jgi:hypothetical protein
MLILDRLMILAATFFVSRFPTEGIEGHLEDFRYIFRVKKRMRNVFGMFQEKHDEPFQI